MDALQLQHSSPILRDFKLESPYDEDIWKITEWNYYKNSDNVCQTKWIKRSNVMDNNMDFTLCDSQNIREELKFICHRLITIKKINLATFAEYTDRFKLLFKYVNNKNVESIMYIDIEDYSNYISKNHKTKTQNGNSFITGKVVSIQKTNRLISFIKTFQSIIKEFDEADLPINKKSVWRAEHFGQIDEKKNKIDFSAINQVKMQLAIRNFLYFKLNTIDFSTATHYFRTLTRFCHWLYEYDDDIISFNQVTREVLEDYYLFLRVESGLSQHEINASILDLSVAFEYGLISENSLYPSTPLFLNTDYYFKTERKANFYTPEEIKSIFSIIPYLPKVYGRILLVLHHCGMRIGEILRLPIDCLKHDGAQAYINTYMYKTERYVKMPINKSIEMLLQKEITYVKRTYPDSLFVFLNDDGSKISYRHFIKTVKQVIAEHDIKDRNGLPLLFGTHRFRATKATELINIGEDPTRAAEMLGHKSLASLSHYVTATQTSLNEYMQEYLRKESIMINSIGKMDAFPLEEYNNAIPLCNGYCCRPVELGVCDKLNACLTCSQFRPTTNHLIAYKLQLAELESSLVVAKENNYTRIIEKCEKEIIALESIINNMEEKINEKHSENDRVQS